MGTYWHKPSFTAADRDADGEIRADALRPGIYCEDQAALDQLRRGARVRSREMTATPSGWLLDGQDVFLCTPEQAAMFRATATVTPEESLAEQRAAHQAGLEAWARARMAMTYEESAAEISEQVAKLQRVIDDRKAAEAAEAVKGDVIGPDGKVDIMASDRLRLRGMGAEEFGRRFMKHAPAKPNRAARRAAAAQARRGA